MINSINLIKLKFLSWILFLTILYIFNPHKLINYFLYLTLPALSVICCFYAARSYGKDNSHHSALLYLSWGFLFVFVAELVTAVTKYIFHITVFPTPSDIFFTIAIVLFFIGILKELRTVRVQISSRMKWFLILTGLVGSAVIIYLIFQPQYTFFQNALDSFFRISQLAFLLLIIIIVLMVLEYRKGTLYYPWLYVVIGMAFNVLGGVILGIFLPQFKSGNTLIVLIVDIFTWGIGYIFLAFGFYYLGLIIENINKTIRLKLKVKSLLKTNYIRL